MKQRILYLCLCLAALLPATAQNTPAMPTTLEGWAARLQKFGKSVPQEQVFIHMDNTCYFLGDTLYYKAYTRRSDTGAPSAISGLLYVELLNQDGYLVERQQLEMKKGQGDGSFCLPDTLYGGYYELRAYTRWQLNWGEYEHPHTRYAERWFFNKKMAREYYRDYEKLYSRVFPVYDKPKTPGEYEHNMTLRPLRRHFKADNSAPQAVLNLYPEGGHLVAGTPNRVAFEANDDEGMHLEGTLAVLDAAGNQVAEAKTEQRGRGSVEFTPAADGKYTAQFTWKKGAGKQKLPDVEPDGCVMNVSQHDGKVDIHLVTAGRVTGEELGMTVTSQGVLQDFQELGKITDKTVTLEAANLRNGVVQATVFNAQGCIYADRLFFVRNAEQETAPMTFTGTAETFEPYSAIKMGVQGGAPGSTISLAVRDAAHTEYTFDNGNIYTEMLLSSQIRGFVEDPGYYFETDDEEHRRALDLLLMIQGWRRFDWYTMAIPGAFTLQYMPEITQMMSGEVNTYQAEQAENAIFEAGLAQSTSVSKTEGEKEAEKADKSSRYTLTGNSEEPDSDDPAAREGQRTMDDAVTTINNMRADADAHFRNAQAQTGETADKMKLFGQSNMKREVVVHAEFTKPGAEQGIVGDVTTEKGLFKIESPRFYDGCYFFLAASDSTKWKGKTADQITWVVPNEDEKDELNYPEFYVKLSPIYPRFVKPYSFYQSNLAQAPKGSALAEDWLNDGSRTLDQVTIGARRNGMSRFDASKPAFVIDAYQAFNEVSDAGIGHGVFVGPDNFANQIARTYIGDMNMERHYEFELRYDSRLANSDQTNWGPKEREVFEHMKNLDKVYIYTDYSPRREGDKHFEANNQPQVIIDLRQFQGNDGPRPVYRDRRYILPGYAVGEVFYQPDYSKNPLPEQKDYRRTLYWNPSLQLDSKGEAQVEFYNNSKKTQICVSAEGMTPDGHLLTGRDAPENH